MIELRYKLKVVALPAGKVTYKVGNGKVVKVTAAKKGNVVHLEARKKGNTTLTIKINGMKKKVKVRVKE